MGGAIYVPPVKNTSTDATAPAADANPTQPVVEQPAATTEETTAAAPTAE